jgi:hypothetical protein
MTALERVAAVLEEARIAGGWTDEDVAADVLQALGLDEETGQPIRINDRAPTSSNMGHG